MKENETERGRERECRERGDFCCWWFDVIMIQRLQYRETLPYSSNYF